MGIALVTTPRSSFGQELATSLAGYAPKDTGFFAELHKLGQLRQRLDETGAWKALMVLVSPTEMTRGVSRKGQRFEGLLGIPLVDAVSELFGEHVAVAAPDWTRLGAGIVLTRVDARGEIDRLIRERKGITQRIQGGVELHQLANELWLATDGRIAVFGARGLEDRFFEQSVELLFRPGQDSLANSTSFVEQVTDLPGGYLGLLYTEMPLAPSRGAKQGGQSPGVVMPSWWPATWPSLRRSAVGMYAAEDGTGIDLALRGRVSDPQPVRVTGGVSPKVFARLPRSTLAAWSFSLDYVSAFKRSSRQRSGQELDERHLLLELVRTWRHSQSLEEMLIRHLGQETIVVLGQQPAPPEALGEQFDRPMLSVMIKAKDRQAVMRGVNEIMNMLVAMTNLRIAADNARLGEDQPTMPLLKVRNEIYGDTMIWRSPWGEVLQNYFRFPFLAHVQVSWAMVDDWLVVSTDPVHIEQLIDARHSDTMTAFASTAAFRAVMNEQESVSMVVSRPAEGARVIQTWIDYLQRSHPEVLEPNWWHRLFSQPRVELGIGFTTDPMENGVLLISHVVKGMPAAGVLHRGDRIEALDGHTLDLKDPKQSFRALMESREKPGEVLVRVRRSGKRMDVPVKIPGARSGKSGFDPVQAIRDLMIVGQPFSAWGYSVSGHEPEKFDARMVLRFQDSKGFQNSKGMPTGSNPGEPGRVKFEQGQLELTPGGVGVKEPKRSRDR